MLVLPAVENQISHGYNYCYRHEILEAQHIWRHVILFSQICTMYVRTVYLYAMRFMETIREIKLGIYIQIKWTRFWKAEENHDNVIRNNDGQILLASSRLQQIWRVINQEWSNICFESSYRHQHSLLKAGKSEGTEKQQQQQRRSVGRYENLHDNGDSAVALASGRCLPSASLCRGVETYPHLIFHFIQVSLETKHSAEIVAYSVFQCEPSIKHRLYSEWTVAQRYTRQSYSLVGHLTMVSVWRLYSIGW
jgi:hypothetical protein